MFHPVLGKHIQQCDYTVLALASPHAQHCPSHGQCSVIILESLQVKQYEDEEALASAKNELLRARFKIELEQASNNELREKIKKLEFEMKARPVVKMPSDSKKVLHLPVALLSHLIWLFVPHHCPASVQVSLHMLDWSCTKDVCAAPALH